MRILRLAIDTHLISSHHLLPLLIARPGGLLVEVTDGTTAFTVDRYRISVFYDLARVAVNRLAFSQAHEFTDHGTAAVAITPGWLRSEMMLDNFGVTEDNRHDALEPGLLEGYPPGSAPRSRRPQPSNARHLISARRCRHRRAIAERRATKVSA